MAERLTFGGQGETAFTVLKAALSGWCKAENIGCPDFRALSNRLRKDHKLESRKSHGDVQWAGVHVNRYSGNPDQSVISDHSYLKCSEIRDDEVLILELDYPKGPEISLIPTLDYLTSTQIIRPAPVETPPVSWDDGDF
jgi:hypothetical protein